MRNAVTDWLAELLDRSETTRNALIGRDPETIGAALKAQEEILRRNPMTAPAAGTRDMQGGENRKTLAELVAKIRRIQRTNKAIAGAFLDAMNRTAASLTANSRQQAATYARPGTGRANVLPVLVRQEG